MSLSNQIGLSRFEMEREYKWLTRNPPKDPVKLVKLVGDAVITLIDKNNAAIAKSLAKLGTKESDENF